MPATPASKTALIHSSDYVDPALIAKHTGAAKIKYTQHQNGWLYGIECREVKEFDTFTTALETIEQESGQRRLFTPILDDNGSTEGRIILNQPFPVKPEHTWKAPNDSKLLIPGLTRLSKQLQVDFAYNVHDAGNGKRKREVAKSETTPPPPPAKKGAPKPKEEIASKAGSSITSFAQSALDAITKSHADAIAAKDATINALTAALVAKDELINAQAEYMRAMRH